MIFLTVYAKAKSIERPHFNNKNVSFEIVLDQAIKNVPYLLVYEQGVYHHDAARTGQKNVTSKIKNGNTYFFDLKAQNKPLYFSVMLSHTENGIIVCDEYFFEPGDSIKILIKPVKYPQNYDIHFSGIGSAKYNCKNEFKTVGLDDKSRKSAFINGIEYDTANFTIRQINRLYHVIEKYKPEMSAYSYNLLHADVLGHAGKDICSLVCDLFRSLKSKSDTVSYKKLSDSFKNRFTYDFTKNVPDNILSESKEYNQFLLNYFCAKTMMESGYIDFKTFFNYIKEVDNVPLRDKLILNYITRYWSLIAGDLDYCLKESLKIISDKSIRARVKSFENNVIGSTAYNFSLRDAKGNTVKLNDYKGKVVFIDFWYTGCGACMDYYDQVLSKVEERYSDNPNIVFITISTDKKEIWQKSLSKGKHTSRKVINLYTNNEGYNHEIIKYYNVRGYPRPLVISRKGNIANIDGRALRDMSRLIAAIEKELDVN